MIDIIKPKFETKFNFLSLGAGVQSSALALMYAHKMFGPLDAAIFSDTQAEPDEVYKWLEALKGYIAKAPQPFPVYVVTQGNLTAEALRVRISKGKGKIPKGEKWIKKILPLFGRMPNGELTADLRRSCTVDYKINPVRKKTKELAGIKQAQREVTVTQAIGISYDEMQRMKLPMGDKWLQHRWPLVEEEIRRGDCKKWMEEKGYPEPPRSACYYCPFHSDKEWRRLKENDPEHFAKAVEFDESLRSRFKKHGLYEMETFIHKSGKPLAEVCMDNPDAGQIEIDFGSECDGMCGV